MRHKSACQSAKEGPRKTQHQHVKRHAIRTSQPLPRIRRDIEIWYDVSQEIEERRDGEEDEETVVQGRWVEEAAGFPWTRENGCTRQEGRERDQGACEGHKSHATNGPGKAASSGDAVEHRDIYHTTLFQLAYTPKGKCSRNSPTAIPLITIPKAIARFFSNQIPTSARLGI